ncbi:hypothetical protein L6R46_03990 [Myxococcota bacterium]|nr:hypothetical protein [Myxococcota bacterium]
MYLHQFSVSGRVETYGKINFAPDLDENQISTDQGNRYAGFSVIYGRGREGKTTALKAIALGLIGPIQANHVVEGQRQFLQNERGECNIKVILHYLYQRSSGQQCTPEDCFPDDRSFAMDYRKNEVQLWRHEAGMVLHGSEWRNRPSFTAFSNPWKVGRIGSESSTLEKFFSLSYPCKMTPTVLGPSQPSIESRHPLVFEFDEYDGYEAAGDAIKDFLAQRTKEQQGSGDVTGVVLIDDFGHSMDDESSIALSKCLTERYPKLQFIVTTASEAFRDSVPAARRFLVRQGGDLVILEQG